MTVLNDSDLQHLFRQPSTLGSLFVIIWLIWRMRMILLVVLTWSFYFIVRADADVRLERIVRILLRYVEVDRQHQILDLLRG